MLYEFWGLETGQGSFSGIFERRKKYLEISLTVV